MAVRRLSRIAQLLSTSVSTEEGQVAAWDSATGSYKPSNAGAGEPGGVPAGGSTGQFLQKTSGTDYDDAWAFLQETDIPAAIARDSEVTAAVAAHAGTNTHAQIDSHLASTSNPHSVTAAQAGALATAAFVGLAKITVGTSAPGSPSAGDLWVDTN